jgi:pseudouridine synthase
MNCIFSIENSIEKNRGKRENKSMLVRLQKIIAACGVASRRHAEELIRQGRVRVNGQIVRQLGIQVDPERDVVSVNNCTLKPKSKKVYLKFNKPPGVVSTCRTYPGEKNIFDYLPANLPRVFPVGRLDKDSEGLVLLTNDGELSQRLTHPRYEHEKEYSVEVERPLDERLLKSFTHGVMLERQKTLPAKVQRTGLKTFKVVLKEGKKRQIRRMVEAAGNKVVFLKRIRIATLKLDNLKRGEVKTLSPLEIKALHAVCSAF